MNLQHSITALLLGSLLVTASAARAGQPGETGLIPAPAIQLQMQQQLQQRLDHRLERDMNARFNDLQTGLQRLAESERKPPAAVQSPQSLERPVRESRPRITLPARLPQRFRQNGTSFI
jgi:hypothetical protein